MKRSDPYRLLGLNPGATEEQVRAAFREKVRQAHPDTAVGAGDGPGVEEIIEAYRMLSDRALRSRHDAAHSVGEAALRGHRVPVRQTGRSEDDADDRYPSCPDCRGSGEQRREVVCPECNGRAQITALDGDRGRVVWCRRCSGRATVTSSQTCPVCSGTGRSPS